MASTFLVMELSLASTRMPLLIFSRASSAVLDSWQVLGPPHR